MHLFSLLQLMLIREWNKDGRSRDLEDVLRAAAHDTDVEDVIHKGEPVIYYNHRQEIEILSKIKDLINRE